MGSGLSLSRARDAKQGGKKLVVFPRISSFDEVSAIRVAISRHCCRVLATVGLLGLAACATPPQGGSQAPAVLTPEAKQALVRQRATSRWELLVKEDLDSAYAYMSPGSRSTTSLDKFKSTSRRGQYRAGRVDTVTCDGDACEARVYVTYDHPKMKGITTPIIESWIIDGGQAWFVYGGR